MLLCYSRSSVTIAQYFVFVSRSSMFTLVRSAGPKTAHHVHPNRCAVPSDSTTSCAATATPYHHRCCAQHHFETCPGYMVRSSYHPPLTFSSSTLFASSSSSSFCSSFSTSPSTSTSHHAGGLYQSQCFVRPKQTRLMATASLSELPPSIEGMVKKITFRSGENGYTVAKVQVEDAGMLEGVVLVTHSPYSRRRRRPGTSQQLITVVGYLPSLNVGDRLAFKGVWEENQKFGTQLKVSETRLCEQPSSTQSLELVLQSTLPKVGPVTAKAIVAHFGHLHTEKVLDSEEAVERLCEVKGVRGRAAAQAMKHAWDHRRRQVCSHQRLQDLGAPPSLTQSILQALTPEQLEESLQKGDLYQTLKGVPGVSFPLLERLTSSLGSDPADLARVCSCIEYCLEEGAENGGHTHLPWSSLRVQVGRRLSTSRWTPEPSLLQKAVEQLEREGHVVCERVDVRNARGQNLTRVGEVNCYLHRYHSAEVQVQQFLASAAKRPPLEVDEARVRRWLGQVGIREGRVLTEEQVQAVITALTCTASLLTGGPGCGKTYTTQSIVRLWRSAGKKVVLCAPTGRAAQRLADGLLEFEASTIHRLLGYRPPSHTPLLSASDTFADSALPPQPPNEDQSDAPSSFSSTPAPAARNPLGFLHNKDNPLEVDCVVVDESSMLDLPLRAALLEALPPGAQLLIVGDPDQLNPIGPGKVLADLLSSDAVPRTRLTSVFRQLQSSAIVSAAGEVNRGQFPRDLREITLQDLRNGRFISTLKNQAISEDGMLDDCWWIRVDESAQGQGESCVADALEEVVKDFIPQILNRLLGGEVFDITDYIQVVSPTRRRGAGVEALNSRLQSLLNPPHPDKQDYKLAGTVFRVGDKVVQKSNDYERDVFNGDLGSIIGVEKTSKGYDVTVQLRDTGRLLVYDQSAMRQLELAWAITVHKAQGSEYPVIILPLSKEHGPMLRRRLLYTALTRARVFVIIVASTEAIDSAVATVGEDRDFGQRLSGLGKRLEGISTSHLTDLDLGTLGDEGTDRSSASASSTPRISNHHPTTEPSTDKSTTGASSHRGNQHSNTDSKSGDGDEDDDSTRIIKAFYN